MIQALIEQWRNEDAAGAGAPPAAGGRDGSGVRAMFEASADLDAPRLARGLQLAQALGLPENVVLEQPEWAERETVARAVEKHPLLAKWAEQDRQNAAFARDDAEGLADVFAAVDGLNPQAPDPALAFEAREQKGLELTRAAKAGDGEARADLLRLQGVSDDEIRYGSLSRTPNPGPLEQLPILLREGTDQVGKSMAGAIAMLAENLQSQAGDGAENAVLRAVARHVRQSVEERERTLPAPLRADSTVGGYAQDVVRMLPQVLGQIGVTYATGGAGGMAFMGGQSAGGQYLDLTEKDVKPGRAAFAALVKAGLQAPLEQIGLGRFMDIFKTSGLGKVLLKTGEAVGTEMLTEYLQEYPEAATTIWAEAEKEGRTTEESVRHFLDRLGEIHRNGLYSAAVAAPFGLLGGAGRIATDAATAREAADFARRHKALHAKVEASRTKRLSPAHMGSALETAGLTGTAYLPASDVLRLYQEGTDIITPLGWQAQDVADAAALGQEWEAPLSRLHARLDAKTFDAVADIMRPEPGTMNAVEAAKLDERLQADVEDVNAAFAEYQAEQNAIDAEVELWRNEVAGAVASVPGLKAKMESGGLTPEATAETYVKPLLNFAERLQEHAGLPVAETLRKLRVRGLVRDGKRLLTPDEMLKREEARAKAEAEAPFWEAVWGRLDGRSLKRDYPDAWRELSRLHGPGLFAKKGGGLALDELADEMEGAYLLEQGGGGDALMERLKQGKKPDRTLFQPVNEGVDLDAPVAVVEVAPRFAGRKLWELMKGPERNALRQELVGVYTNRNTGWSIKLTGTGVEHAVSSAKKSMDGRVHMEAVTGLPGLIENAVLVETHADRKGQRLAAVHRMYAPMRLDNEMYAVKLTVKESDAGMVAEIEDVRKLYDLALEKKMPGDLRQGPDTAQNATGNQGSTPGISEITLRQLLEGVKDSEGQAFFQRGPAVVVRGDELGVPEGASIKKYQKAAREVYRGLQKTPAHRDDLGEIRFTTAGFGKMLVSGADPRKWKLVPRLKEIIERADYIGRRGLEKERKDEIVAFHWLEGDVLLDGVSLRVGLQIAEDRQGNKFYNLNQDLEAWREKYEAPDRADIRFGGQELHQDAQASHAFNIATPPDGVNLHFLEQQGGKADARGSIKPTPEGHLIQLYQKADLSTLLHEMGHFFLLELDDAVRAGLADDTLKADYAALRRWLKAEDGAELTREQHEQFARGFEAYLMEGKAPSASLESAFARFKKWLTRIYQKARALNVDLTDEVRGVFDRLLATEAEVNARAVENGLVDLSARELDALGLKGAEREAVSGLMRAAVDAAEARMRADRDRQRREQVRQWTAEARAEVDADPLYGAMRDMLPARESVAAKATGGTLTEEERAALRRFLLEEDPIVSLSGREFAKAETPLLDRVAEFFAGIREVASRALQGGMVELSKNGVRSSIRHGMSRKKAAAFAAVPEVLRRGALVAKEENFKGRHYDSYILAAPVSIGNERHLMAVVVHRQRNRNATYYLHEVALSDSFRDDGNQTGAPWPTRTTAPGNVFNIVRQTLAVNATESRGLDLEAVRRDMGEDYAARLTKRLPGAFRKEGGADPAMFAAEHGFRDPADLFRAMLDAPTKAARVRAIVDAKQQAWDANFDPADYLLETDEAARQMELVGQYVARALGGRAAEQRALKRVVAAKLAAMSMGQATQPGTYRMNMRRALTAERRAIVKGEWQAALEANFQARINMEFARQSLDLKRSVETLQAQIRRFTGMSKADPDARFLVGALAQRHGLGKLDTRLATEERKNPGDVLAAWIEAAQADGCPVIMDDAFARPDLPWRDLSVEAFGDLAETIRQIVTVERNRRKLLTARSKADLDEAAAEIAASVAAFRESAPLKTVEKENAALKSLKGLHAIHAKVEALCLALDGDKQGPVWEYIYRPITRAEDEQSVRFREARDELRTLFGVFSRQELFAMRRNREYIESVGEKMTRENMLALALNMGNETNIQRVKEGHGWTDDRIGDVLSRLTRRDWEFVQSVWDYFETFKAESFQLQEDITGLRPQAVEAKPLTVTTADGHTLTLRGGYYPITYNAEKGFLAYEREQRQLDKEFFGGNSHSAAQTRQGHLKERARRGTGEPLLLELSVVTDHVFNVIHDLSYRRAVLDVAKVIRHPKVREALTGAVGMGMVNQLKPWLMDVANERQEPMHAVHRWANWARASTSIIHMGWKVTTMLAQPLGILQTAEVLGYGYTAAGMKKVYAHPLRLPELLEETFARSPMMADRIKSFDREIWDMTKKLMPSSGLFGWVDTVRDSAFVPIGVMQMGVDLPTWWGGFAKGLRDFRGDEAKAAEYADSVVRLSQGSGTTKDLARVQRGGPLPRLFTMFYSYFNTFYNLAARRFTALRKDHSPAAVFRAANTALLLWFVPAVLGELMAGRGPDDDDEWDEWAGMLVMQYPFQAVVGVRDVANHVFGEYGYRITPAQAAPKALGQWFKSVNKALEGAQDASRRAAPPQREPRFPQGGASAPQDAGPSVMEGPRVQDAPSRAAPPQREPRFPQGGASAPQDAGPSVMEGPRAQDAGRLVKPTVEAAGYLFGLPMKQPIITVGNMWDYLTGEDPEFEVRDLFFVKPRDRR